jgi:hypothetical protein
VVTDEHKKKNRVSAENALKAAINEQFRTQLARQVLEFGSLVDENCDAID